MSFSYSIQLAGVPHSQADHKGQIGRDAFVTMLKAFPWEEQRQRYDKLNIGASATVDVSDDSTDTSLFVSIATDKKLPVILVGYVYKKPVRSFFGLGKPTIRRWVDIFVVADMDTVVDYYHQYFDGQHEDMRKKLYQEKMFESLEAPND